MTTDSFRFPQGFKIDEGRRQIYLPSIGWVKYKRSRFIQGKAKNVTVSRQADGWHVSIQTEYETEPPRHAGDSVGIDMGCVRFCTLSDGTFFVRRTQERAEEARPDAAQARKNAEVREELAQTEGRDYKASSAYRQCPS